MSAAALAAVALMAVVPVPTHHAPPVKVVVSEHYLATGGRINVHPPTRLDVLMTRSDGTAIHACLSWGGEPIMYPARWNYRPLRGRVVCEDIDY